MLPQLSVLLQKNPCKGSFINHVDQFSGLFDPPPPCGPNMDFWLTPLANHVDFSDTPPFLKFFYSKIIHNLLRKVIFLQFFWKLWCRLFFFLNHFWKRGILKQKKVHMDHPLDPPSPLVDWHGQFGNPPSPLTGPRGLWMTPKLDVCNMHVKIYWSGT